MLYELTARMCPAQLLTVWQRLSSKYSVLVSFLLTLCMMSIWDTSSNAIVCSLYRYVDLWLGSHRLPMRVQCLFIGLVGWRQGTLILLLCMVIEDNLRLIVNARPSI